jgi:hypothetical protein
MKAFLACQESIVTPDFPPETTMSTGAASIAAEQAAPVPSVGQIVVGDPSFPGKTVQIHVSNRTDVPVTLHLCTYDCTDTGDCRTSAQKLTQDKRKLIESMSGRNFTAELACVYQWDVLLGEDVCPDTYIYGNSYPNLELLKAGLGDRGCNPPTTTTVPPSCPEAPEKPCPEAQWLDYPECKWTKCKEDECILPEEQTFTAESYSVLPGNPAAECGIFGALPGEPGKFFITKCGQFYELTHQRFTASQCSNGQDVSHVTACLCPE